MPRQPLEHGDASLLGRPLRWLTAAVLWMPRVTLGVALVVAVVSIVLAVYGLGFRTRRLDLLNPASDFNQLWLAYIREFGDRDDVILVVRGDDPAAVISALDELAVRLAREPGLFDHVLHAIDLSPLQAKGLHYLRVEQVEQVEQFVRVSEPIRRNDWSGLELLSILAPRGASLAAAPFSSSSTAGASAAGAELGQLAESLQGSLAHGRFFSPWMAELAGFDQLRELRLRHLLAAHGRLGMILLFARGNEQGFDGASQAVDALRRIMAEVGARHEGVQIGLTGLPVLENDEMRASRQDMLEASLLSLAGVLCLFVAGFGGLRHPLMAVAALLLAIVWSLGYITLSVGHLNILSISFGVILIGLGIDFGIHYVARYLELLPRLRNCREAILRTAASAGPGIAVGGLTTALAFFMVAVTEFQGVAELGMIAGGGILLCLLSTLLVLPVILWIADRSRWRHHVPVSLPVDGWLRPWHRAPECVLWLTLSASTLLGVGGSRLWYDHNLLNLQPASLDSVVWERVLLSEAGQGAWFALSVADSPAALLARKQRFLELSTVERVEEIVSLIPADDPARTAAIERIGRLLKVLPARPGLIPACSPRQLDQALERRLDQLDLHDPRASALRGQLDAVRQQLRRMSPAAAGARLAEYQQQLAWDLLGRLHLVRGLCDPVPPQWSDLPPELRVRFVGKHGRHVLKIFARGDVWDMAALERFVADVKRIDPQATGQPLQTFYASRQMQQSYVQAAIYALIVVIVVVGFDLGSISDTLLALLPMSLGLVQLCGIMGWLNIPMNPANMIVLPLILGIGIDDGVHVIHDFRRQVGRYRLSRSVATAVIITSLTTNVGFGSLILARHEGLRSLGRVLTLGVTCCLINSLVLLPALLVWLTRHRAADPSATCATASTAWQLSESTPCSDAVRSGGGAVPRRAALPPQAVACGVPPECGEQTAHTWPTAPAAFSAPAFPANLKTQENDSM